MGIEAVGGPLGKIVGWGVASGFSAMGMGSLLMVRSSPRTLTSSGGPSRRVRLMEFSQGSVQQPFLELQVKGQCVPFGGQSRVKIRHRTLVPEAGGAADQ